MFTQQEGEDDQQNMKSPRKEEISLLQQVRLDLGAAECVTPAPVKKR